MFYSLMHITKQTKCDTPLQAYTQTGGEGIQKPRKQNSWKKKLRISSFRPEIPPHTFVFFVCFLPCEEALLCCTLFVVLCCVVSCSVVICFGYVVLCVVLSRVESLWFGLCWIQAFVFFCSSLSMWMLGLDPFGVRLSRFGWLMYRIHTTKSNIVFQKGVWRLGLPGDWWGCSSTGWVSLL